MSSTAKAEYQEYTKEQYQEYFFEGRACAACRNKIQDALLCQIIGAKCDFINNCIKLPPGEEERAKKIVSDIEPCLTLVAAKPQGSQTQVCAASENTVNQSESLPREIFLFILAGCLFAGGFTAQYLIPSLPLVEAFLFLGAYLLMGLPVIRTAGRNIAAGKVFDENFLMTIASFGAIAIGHLPEAAGVMLFYQTGEFLQDRAVGRSRKLIKSLMDIRPDTASVKINGTTAQVPAETVDIGDIIVVKPGEKVPLDGKIIEGNSYVDTSALTGEHVPKRVAPGEQVSAGSVNGSGILEIRVSNRFEDSSVSKMLDLVEQAGERKAPTERFITKFARYYTPAVVFGAAGTAILPPLLVEGAQFSVWFYRALVMLVVSCPCALVISIPLGYFGGIGGASRNGILVKGANYLDSLTQVDTMVFDKTGTLTRGEFKVSEITSYNGYSPEEVLELAAKVEFYSNHPIAASILEHYRKAIAETASEGTGASVKDYQEIPGKGVRATVNGQSVLAGNAQFFEEAGIHDIPFANFGTAVFLAVDNRLAGRIIISDAIRRGAPAVIDRLKKAGVRKTVLLTGDQKPAAAFVADQLNIDEYHYGLLPQDKVSHLEKSMQERNLSGKGQVAFVGDGINDAPVIRVADIGIAMGGLGADAAIESADVVIMNDALEKIPQAVEIARFTKKIVFQNILLALGIKALVIAMGTVGLASLWEAVFADVGVALLAILNATRALSFKSQELPGKKAPEPEFVNN